MTEPLAPATVMVTRAIRAITVASGLSASSSPRRAARPSASGWPAPVTYKSATRPACGARPARDIAAGDTGQPRVAMVAAGHHPQRGRGGVTRRYYGNRRLADVTVRD